MTHTPQSQRHPFYCHISGRACYDPVRTIYLCAPGEYARREADARRFAELSGWTALAEESGAVLIVPLAVNGWDREPAALLAELFAETRNSFPVPNGPGLYGRDGMLWCWETMVDIVGYEDGAVFAGNALAASPGLFAAAVLVNGAPEDLSPGDLPSGHYMVPQLEDYPVRNREVPVCLWMFLRDREDGREAAAYFARSCGAAGGPAEMTVGGMGAEVWRNAAFPARQVRLSQGTFGPEPALAGTIFRELFEKTIRWKCGPDGALTPILGKEEFYSSPRFARESVNGYGCFVHRPAGREDRRGLALLISLHGRGEPAWMFAQKNGWDDLADETGAFILAAPDSPENIWFLDRDGENLAELVRTLTEKYDADPERVYLTGFSNGAMMTRQAGTAFPGLFAGLAPCNGPHSRVLPGAGGWQDTLAVLEAEGWEMPYFSYAGDRDGAAPPAEEELLDLMLRLNGCGGEPDAVYTGDNAYTPDRGYAEGERQRTEVWLDKKGVPRVTRTVMKDMPHGAIPDESRSAWEFLRRYRRPAGSRTIAYVEEEKA